MSFPLNEQRAGKLCPAIIPPQNNNQYLNNTDPSLLLAVTYCPANLLMNTYKNLWPYLLLVSLIYHFSLLYANLNVYDEGIILTGAERVKNGEVPYLDFWTIYPPGQFYVLGGLFKTFGSSVLVERIYDLIIRCFLSIMPYLISRRLGCNNRTSILSWVMAMMYLGSFTFFVYPVYPALLFILLGVYIYLGKEGEKTNRQWFLSGVFIGVAALFRHDLAFFACVTFCIVLLLDVYGGKGSDKFRDGNGGNRKASYRSGKDKDGNRKAAIRSGNGKDGKRAGAGILQFGMGKLLAGPGIFLAGVLLVGLPAAVFFIDQVGLELLLDHLVRTPAEIMPRFRALPYPSPFYLDNLQFYIFPGILLIGLGITLVLIIRKKVRAPVISGFLLLFLIGTLSLNQVRVRSDMIHLLPAGLICITLIPAFFTFVFRPLISQFKMGRFRIGHLSSIATVLVIALPFIIPLYKEAIRFNPRHYTMTVGWSPVTKSGVSWISPEMVDVVQYLQSHSEEGEPIYVGTSNHDQFVISDVAIYFLANRPPGTRYHELHPGVASTPEVQRQIMADLKGHEVKTLVMAPRFWEEPNESRIDTGTDLLDEYIRRRYRLVEQFGIYEIWELL